VSRPFSYAPRKSLAHDLTSIIYCSLLYVKPEPLIVHCNVISFQMQSLQHLMIKYVYRVVIVRITSENYGHNIAFRDQFTSTCCSEANILRLIFVIVCAIFCGHERYRNVSFVIVGFCSESSYRVLSSCRKSFLFGQ